MTDNAVAVRTRVRPALLAAVRAVPVWAWLAGIVVASTLIRYALGRRIVAPWIMIDELIYSELAKSFAASGHFLIRGEASNVYGFVYPVLISPAWAIFGKVPTPERLMAHRLPLMLGLGGLYASIEWFGRIEPTLRALLNVHVAALYGSAY